jgi:3-methyladenine DNA glycosylase/8-oxoguanine DNA glycosylase
VTVVAETVLERSWRPSWPCPVGSVLGSVRRGPGDPTYTVDADRTIWKAWRTPQGLVTLAVRPLDRCGEVRATAWGPGAEWVLDGLPELLGAGDDPTGFRPVHPVLARAWDLHPHWRVPRTRLVLDALVPAVLEQKVTGKEAFASQRRLVRRYGEPAPGEEAARRGLMVMPDPHTLRTIPSWEWLRFGVDHARSRTLLRAVEVAPALERLVHLPHAEADRRLRTLPGIGVWTSAEVRARALGDPDAVSFGDYHVAKDIGWALTGRPVDDEQLAVLLEPYLGHRLRVQVLVNAAGLRRPRRGPRMTLPTHLPTSAVGR